jgi:hypothetical protein
MIVTEYDIPWKHVVIDNFLDQKTFDWIENHLKNKRHFVKGQPKYKENHLAIEPVSEIHKKLSPFVLLIKDKYFDKLNYANKPCPDVYYPHIQIMVCNSNFSNKAAIHQDDDNKLMTIILYVYPKNSYGTYMFSDNKIESLVKQIEWKPNRAVCFVSQRNPDFQQSWHSFDNPQNDIRLTVNLTLEKEIRTGDLLL